MDLLEDEKCCRICLEPDQRINLIAPCSCSGSQKWVHRECLNRWRATREDRAFSRCTECLTPYILITPKDEKNARYWGNIRFYCYSLRDIFIALIVILLITIGFSFIVYEIDSTKYLATLLGCEKQLKLFYYGCGIFLFLSLVGILSSFAMCMNVQQLGDSNCCCCCNSCGPDCCRSNDIYLPLYFNSDPSSSCCCCCCSNSHECASCGACMNSCETCSLCEGCTAASCEQEALVFLLIGLLIFAIIGIFVSVVVGIYFVQKVTNSHIHYLHKHVLTKDYIVKDLDSDGGLGNGVGDIELGESTSTKGILSRPLQDEYQIIRHEESIENSQNHSHYGINNNENNNPNNNNNNLTRQGYLSSSQQQELDRLGLL